MRFLTREWFDAMAEAAAAAPAPEGVGITVGQEVRGAPDGDVAYRVEVGAGGVRMTWGTTDGADITIVQDYATAVLVARGELPAQQAVAEGRLKLRGDTSALVRSGPALAAVASAFRSIRDRTEW